MWRDFFCDNEWLVWSWAGIIVISAGSWYQVHLDVRVNAWFGDFYDLLQKALSKDKDTHVTRQELYGYIFTFSEIAAIYILVEGVHKQTFPSVDINGARLQPLRSR